ncbi:hypothetical protein VDG1235_768 [Verrucomicrobiia bacterium DG1235]|nr:hypothetical protein VDG1235_768 [Verrucomicrobiae bacterium DG1235]
MLLDSNLYMLLFENVTSLAMANRLLASLISKINLMLYLLGYYYA